MKESILNVFETFGFNSEQVKGALDRILTVGVTWLLTTAVAKGWISKSDAAELGPIAIAAFAGFFGWWVNRRKAIDISAANLGAVVLTTAEIAKATPNHPNIMSLTDAPSRIASVVEEMKQQSKAER